MKKLGEKYPLLCGIVFFVLLGLFVFFIQGDEYSTSDDDFVSGDTKSTGSKWWLLWMPIVLYIVLPILGITILYGISRLIGKNKKVRSSK